MSDTGYIVYLDEAGDFGLKNVTPIDERGASEWFVMGAVVVRKENEAEVPRWLRSIRDDAKSTQSIDLHFRTLSNRQKLLVCQKLAELHVRLFVVVSNKQNMRRYRNQSASRISQHKHWFYWWIARLILERVTDFCATRNEQEGVPDRKLQIEFSRRKDLRRHEFTDYFTRLWAQAGSPYLNKRRIDWSVFDWQNVHFYDHRSRAGLQMADVVASSFYQAVNVRPHGTCYPEYAKLLMPRIYHPSNGKWLDEGFTVQPYSLADAELNEDQKEIFRHYGYPESRLTKMAARDHSSRGR